MEILATVIVIYIAFKMLGVAWEIFKVLFAVVMISALVHGCSAARSPAPLYSTRGI
jgi:hypothetical protein